MKNSLVFLIEILVAVWGSFALASGTVIGNGGDPVLQFLEAARYSMLETTKVFLNDADASQNFCQTQQIDDSQKDFCQEFLRATAQSILRKGYNEKKFKFVLRSQPLHVVGPDGAPMVVAARTTLGPEGPIEFHRDSVKSMLPTQLLFLIVHEYLHKVEFQNSYVDDNTPIGPFSSGRDLLDAVALALVKLASDTGRVGNRFGIQDSFNCKVNVGGAGLNVTLLTNRLFLSADLMQYETNIGQSPNDAQLSVDEDSANQLHFRMRIFEPGNCGDPDSQRKTDLSIVRVTSLENGELQEELLSSQSTFTNPICAGNSKSVELAYDQVKFKCSYFGSSGTTSFED